MREAQGPSQLFTAPQKFQFGNEQLHKQDVGLGMGLVLLLVSTSTPP